MPVTPEVVVRVVTGDEAITAWDIPWSWLRFQHTQAVRSVLTERYAHSTANRILSALRGVLKAAWKLGQMSAEDYQKAASVESVGGETVPAGRALSAGELVALLDSCEARPLGVRDAAIISLLYGCGLRRAALLGSGQPQPRPPVDRPGHLQHAPQAGQTSRGVPPFAPRLSPHLRRRPAGRRGRHRHRPEDGRPPPVDTTGGASEPSIRRLRSCTYRIRNGCRAEKMVGSDPEKIAHICLTCPRPNVLRGR
jgi:integrase